MSRIMVFPAWLSVLSLAVALFVPLGVSLISDTSVDAGNRQGMAADGGKAQFAPVREGVPAEQARERYFALRV
jgi:hypothetical protein